METKFKLSPWTVLRVLFTLLCCQLVFGQGAPAFAEDTVYTNEDLKPAVPVRSAPPYRLEPIMKRSDFNPYFDELHAYVEYKLERIRIPEYKRYLLPLFPGMTQEQVKQLWGPRTVAGTHEQNDPKTWTVDTASYEIGISLFFKNNELKGWKIYKQPQFNTPKNAKTIDYKDLMKIKEENPKEQKEKRGLKEDEQVMVSIRGCQTLQEALDGKAGSTDAVVAITRHWRTMPEICDTVGQGCKACGEASSQIKQ